MKVLEYIHIKNSFAHKDTLVEFSEGKNYIVGNYGSGKSEIIELIGFAFFGSVSLRGKASTYPKLEVELVFNHSNNKFKINRKVSDASLYLYDTEEKDYKIISVSTTGVNEKIVSLLGYDYNIYLLSNYCQQGELQYFSKLTPAKRLQFIDKVSGIEDSKDLLVFLTTKKKELNSSLKMLSNMVTEPVIPEGVELTTNYKSIVVSLDAQLNSSIELFNKKSELEASVKSFKPVPILDSFTQIYGNLTEEEYQNLIDIQNQYYIFEKECDNLDTKIKQLNKLIIKELYETGVVDQNIVNDYLKQSMINSLQDVSITCPSCSNNVHIKDIKKPIKWSVKDLSNYLEFINSLDDYNKLNIELPNIKQSMKDLVESVDPKFSEIFEYSVSTFKTKVQIAKSLFLQYNNALEFNDAIKKENDSYKISIDLIDKQLNDYSLQRKALTDARDEAVKNSIKLDFYLKEKEIYDRAIVEYNKLSKQYAFVVTTIDKINEITTNIKNDTVPLINYHASKYLNIMTKGVMTDIKITDNYDLIVDGFSINLKSGAQKDLSSLAFRLSLGQSIILGMLPLFIGDECDSSSPNNVADDITEALETMISSGYQIILVTHKDISNIENSNIINLG